MGGTKRAGEWRGGDARERKGVIGNARQELQKKSLEKIVANSLRVEGAGFGGDTNVVTMITENEELSLGKMSKEETASKIMDRIMDIRAAEDIGGSENNRI